MNLAKRQSQRTKEKSKLLTFPSLTLFSMDRPAHGHTELMKSISPCNMIVVMVLVVMMVRMVLGDNDDHDQVQYVDDEVNDEAEEDVVDDVDLDLHQVRVGWRILVVQTVPGNLDKI